MVEPSDNFRAKLYKSNAFQHALSFYDLEKLLELRLVSKKMADEIIPRNIKSLRFECPDEEDEEQYTFHNHIKHATRIEIRNVCGSEAHLKIVQSIAENQVGKCEYLILEIDDEEGTEENEDLARRYVEVFRKNFPSIKTLKIETIGDRNFTRMLQLMMEDSSFPWFESVTTIKCYQVRNLRDMNVIKDFFCRFKNLECFKGITEDEFNPLDVIMANGKKIPSLSWTIPEKENLRNAVLEFLKYNQTPHLKLYAGGLEKVVLTDLHLEHTRHLYLYDFASFELPEVYAHLPDLLTFFVQNLDDFKKENFQVVVKKLTSYRGLQCLGLELLQFELEEVKEDFFQILRTHSDSLTHLCLGRNKVSNALMKEICNEIREGNRIETLDLTHMKEANKIEWKDYLTSIASLSANRKGNPIRIILSDYQTRTKHTIFQEHLSTAKPNVEIIYQVQSQN